MRLLILAAAAALTLGACKNNDQHDNTMNIDENLTAENIVSNDVTAIDAVTADAANMAADVNYTEVGNDLDNETNAAAPVSRPSPLQKLRAGRPSNGPRRLSPRPTHRRTRPNKIRATRAACASAATGAISAASSPGESLLRRPLHVDRSPSAGPGNGRNPSFRSRPDRLPLAARPASAHPRALNDVGSGLRADADPVDAPPSQARVPLVSAAMRNPRSCNSSIRARRAAASARRR